MARSLLDIVTVIVHSYLKVLKVALWHDFYFQKIKQNRDKSIKSNKISKGKAK